MEDDQVIINVGLEGLISSLRDLKAEYDANAKAIKNLDKESETYEQDIVKLQQQQKVLKKEMSGVEGQIQNVIKAERAQEDSLVQLRAKLNNLNKQYDSMSGMQRMGKDGLELRDRMKALHEQILGLEGATGRMQRNVGNYPGAIEPVKKQLKDLTDALIQMRMEGKQNTEEYNEMLAKAGQLKDAMADTSREMKQMASDTSALNSVLDGAKLAAGGFSAALGVMNLIGGEDSETAKELADAQKKLQATIAITTGIQAVQNALQKESALMMGIHKIQTWAAAKAQEGYTAATGRATIAQRLFNAVANANPYVLLAGALATVIGAIVAFTAGTKEQKEATEELNVQLKKESELLTMLTSKYAVMSKGIIDADERIIQKRKAEGASIEEIRRLEDRLHEEKMDYFKAERQDLDFFISNYATYREEYARISDEINGILKNRIANADRLTEAEKAAMDAGLERAQKDLERYSALIGLVDDFNERYFAEIDSWRDKENQRAEEDRQRMEQNKQAYLKAQQELREASKAFHSEIEMLSLDEMAENSDKLAQSIKKVADAVGLFDQDTQGLRGLERLNEVLEQSAENAEDAPSKFDSLAAAFANSEESIQETSSALQSSFSSIASMYQQLAKDESKTEDEREKAALRARQWSRIQIAANAGTAVAKGVASAVDVGFPAAIPAMATMMASILSAIAQAKALAEGFASGGVVGGFGGASLGADNTIIHARTGEMVLNAEQQRRLFEIANTRSEQPNIAEQLAAAIALMPAPVLEYSEFRRFQDNVISYNEQQTLK